MQVGTTYREKDWIPISHSKCYFALEYGSTELNLKYACFANDVIVWRGTDFGIYDWGNLFYAGIDRQGWFEAGGALNGMFIFNILILK